MASRAEKNKSNNKDNKEKRKLKAFIEPKLTKQESLVKSTLFPGAAAPGAAAVGTS
ncbi:hypothetical protein IIC38_19790 [candidate division KSB1 bacterium]|nr:hypothetical protein [candidate division KSB1 bacterium]